MAKKQYAAMRTSLSPTRYLSAIALIEWNGRARLAILER